MKKWIGIGVVCVLLLSLIGCGNGQNTENATE